jgi:hypothetical protein
MTSLFYFGSLGLFGLGVFFSSTNLHGSQLGDRAYQRRRALKIAGEIFLIGAILLVGLAAISQYTSSF